jgi:polar amino acid transport system permease protein
VLPQAMRVIVPPTGNETISMLKTTSLVVVIAYFELTVAVQTIYSARSRRSRCSSWPPCGTWP